MNHARVVGTLWATRKDPNLNGTRLQLIQPLNFDGSSAGETMIAVDTIGAGTGEYVLVVTSSEAVIPMDADMAPVDASIVGILSRVDLMRK